MPKIGSHGVTTPKKRRKKQATPDRVRFVVEQCPHRITGIVNIPGLQLEPPEHESNLERNAIHLLACCADLVAISSQPLRIQFDQGEGKTAHYILDLLIRNSDGELLRIEVKPLKVALTGETAEKLLRVAQHFARACQPFDILTDDVISQEPRLSVAIRLRGFLTQAVPGEIHEKVRQLLAPGPRKIGDLLEQLGGEQVWSSILALVAQRHLCISWDEPCTREMRVSLPDHPFTHLTYAALATSGRFRPLVQELALGRRPSDRQLLAAALAEDRTISVPDAYSAVGEIPRRGMQVDRALGCGRARRAGGEDAKDPGPSADGQRTARGER